ncbi:hypothetical protein EJ08DRAFT_365404 [Tothia fuscella]|uniref:Uncharacterized protein n=1 Tax=Tothia fuscella TaxID=1048955 RepID=A0A9P4NLT7_9PEZI|nr:hypothetical protein EJ08DRAFT_365404 [Tothia fuscella]
MDTMPIQSTSSQSPTLKQALAFLNTLACSIQQIQPIKRTLTHNNLTLPTFTNLNASDLHTSDTIYSIHQRFTTLKETYFLLLEQRLTWSTDVLFEWPEGSEGSKGSEEALKFYAEHLREQRNRNGHCFGVPGKQGKGEGMYNAEVMWGYICDGVFLEGLEMMLMGLMGVYLGKVKGCVEVEMRVFLEEEEEENVKMGVEEINEEFGYESEEECDSVEEDDEEEFESSSDVDWAFVDEKRQEEFLDEGYSSEDDSATNEKGGDEVQEQGSAASKRSVIEETDKEEEREAEATHWGFLHPSLHGGHFAVQVREVELHPVFRHVIEEVEEDRMVESKSGHAPSVGACDLVIDDNNIHSDAAEDVSKVESENEIEPKVEGNGHIDSFDIFETVTSNCGIDGHIAIDAAYDYQISSHDTPFQNPIITPTKHISNSDNIQQLNQDLNQASIRRPTPPSLFPLRWYAYPIRYAIRQGLHY